MKKTILSLLGCFLVISSFAQVTFKEGSALNNDEDDRMNRMIDGENGTFYSYRIRTKGKGTTYIIENVNQATMKVGFSSEVPIPTEKTKVLDVQYVGGKVYVIYRTYDKDAEIMSLKYKTVSTDGKVSAAEGEILNRKTDHYEFIDFDITANQKRSKLAVKTTFKANKEATYKTDFVLFDGASQKVEWTKTVNKFLKRSNPWFDFNPFKASSTETVGFLGFILNDNNDIYFAYNDKLKKEDEDDLRYNAAVEILKAESQKSIVIPLDLNPEYLVYDVMFSMNKQNNLVIAGFFKDVVERKGRDLVDVGVFNYRINSTTGAVEGKATKTFDEKILTALESNRKKSRRMIYKADYILTSGDDFYLVGEQYRVVKARRQENNPFAGVKNLVALASGANPFNVGYNFIYEYMDVIVTKINAKGEFEWVSNSPLRNGTTTEDNPHIFKQYIAVNSTKGIYLFYNEHPKNSERLAKADFEPSDLKTQIYIHGSNFVFSKITPDGKVDHAIAFENKTYCFAPIQERNIQFTPPQEAEIFIKGKQDEILIYTEDRGKGRFCTINMK